MKKFLFAIAVAWRRVAAYYWLKRHAPVTADIIFCIFAFFLLVLLSMMNGGRSRRRWW